jgi:hypothetical protein
MPTYCAPVYKCRHSLSRLFDEAVVPANSSDFVTVITAYTAPLEGPSADNW